jgi:hypothetical protein
VVASPGEEEERTGDGGQVCAAAVDDESPVDELVATGEVLDQPQLEGTGDVPGVLEPVLEDAIALDVLGVVDVLEERERAPQLRLRLHQDEVG